MADTEEELRIAQWAERGLFDAKYNHTPLWISLAQETHNNSIYVEAYLIAYNEQRILNKLLGRKR